jgi:hypothetical protein
MGEVGCCGNRGRSPKKLFAGGEDAMKREFEVSHKKESLQNTPSLAWIDVDKVKPNAYNPNVVNTEKFEVLRDFLKTHSAEELDPVSLKESKRKFTLMEVDESREVGV